MTKTVFLLVATLLMATPAFGEKYTKEINAFVYANMASQGGDWNCIKLNSIELDSTKGYVSWFFEYSTANTKWCQGSTIHNLTSEPEKQIRNVLGLQEKTIRRPKKFTIITTPNTRCLNFYYDRRGNLPRDRKICLGGAIEDLKVTAQRLTTSGDWLTNFNQSESLLAEAKASDKTAPSIQVFAPTPGNDDVIRVDTYTSFVRGKASDAAGVMNILVQGKKVGAKADGTFASKVKLAIGSNVIRIQAEDVNGNIAEKNVTIKLFNTKDFLVYLFVCTGICKIIKCFISNTNNMVVDKIRAFFCTIFLMF